MKTGISTDCVCDLPEEYLKLHDIGIAYFYIITATGRFRDGEEIDSRNIIEYLEEGGEKAETFEPTPDEYKELFEQYLGKYDEIVHICISSDTSAAYKNACEGLELMGDMSSRVHVIDSHHLSTGMGHMIIRAVDMRDKGSGAEEIVSEMESLKKRVSTSFITRNVDYLYRNGRVSKSVRDFSAAFRVYPVLTMKNGRMTLKNVQTGSYEKSVVRYIKSELRHNRKINKKRLFITHAGCTVRMINALKAEIERLYSFDEVIVTTASATVSSNCGPGAIGVLYIIDE
ncbi:MAG: DegV family protein [Oscillospiraceae bacterium]|nr:DegV family protein [Oscillospiraceae bacterium]